MTTKAKKLQRFPHMTSAEMAEFEKTCDAIDRGEVDLVSLDDIMQADYLEVSQQLRKKLRAK